MAARDCRGTPGGWTRLASVPAEVVELAEREQDDCGAAEEEHQADRAPENRAARGAIADERVVGEVVGVGMRCAWPLCRRSPGGPAEKRRELAQFGGIGDGAAGESAVDGGVREVRAPVGDLGIERRLAVGRQPQGPGGRVVAVGLEFCRHRAVDGGSLRLGHRRVRGLESGLRETFGPRERKIVQGLGGEIRPQHAPMAPDGPVVHQAVLEKDLLTGRDLRGREDERAVRIDRPHRDRRRIPIGIGREQDQDGEAENHHDREGPWPPGRQRFGRLGRRCGHRKPPYSQWVLLKSAMSGLAA